jgi:hypothetical protein
MNRGCRIGIVLGLSLAFSACASHWTKLPSPPERSESVLDIGLDEDDGLWMMAGTGVFFWDGERFRIERNLTAGTYVAALWGGREGGLFASQLTESENEGSLFRLKSGTSELVTKFRFDVKHDYPGLHVTRSGRILNWTRDQVAIYSDGVWHEWRASAPIDGAQLLESSEDLYLVAEERLYCVDSKDRFSELPVTWPDAPPGSRRVALWGEGEALVVVYGQTGLRRLLLATGKLSEAVALNERIGPRRLFDLTRAPDGSVWLIADDPDLRGYVLVTISRSGELTFHEWSAGFRLQNDQFRSFPESVSFDGDGSLWLGLADHGLIRFRERRLSHYYADETFDLSGVRRIEADRHGDIYAASSWAVYRLGRKRGSSIELSPLPQPAWLWTVDFPEQILRAWSFGNRSRSSPATIAASAFSTRTQDVSSGKWKLPPTRPPLHGSRKAKGPKRSFCLTGAGSRSSPLKRERAFALLESQPMNAWPPLPTAAITFSSTVTGADPSSASTPTESSGGGLRFRVTRWAT